MVGLAFQALDTSRPDGHQEVGITCALIPVPTAGMLIGRRHRPMNSAFMNGPIREQFGLPIGRFHAIAGTIARMAIDLYATGAARRYTAAALDAGERPSVASAILKVQLTEAGRPAVNDGMDILGGKGIMRGPGNPLGVAYHHAPIAITVQGANLLTRALIIFGQGAVRCHPQGRVGLEQRPPERRAQQQQHD